MEVRLHPLEFTRYRLPFVCAVTGAPAASYSRMAVGRSLHPAALLLLLLGPLGWLALIALAIRRNGTYVEVPISQQVHDEIHERRRRLRWMLAVLIASVMVFVALANAPMFPGAWLAFLPALAAGSWVGAVRGHYGLRLSIDGVGLVTIRKVHPQFVAAIEQWRRQFASSTTPL